MILGTEEFLNDIIDKTTFGDVKLCDTKCEQIKCLKICSRIEFQNIYDFLYDNSTIRLERKYNKWSEIKSAFAAGAVKQIG